MCYDMRVSNSVSKRMKLLKGSRGLVDELAYFTAQQQRVKYVIL